MSVTTIRERALKDAVNARVKQAEQSQTVRLTPVIENVIDTTPLVELFNGIKLAVEKEPAKSEPIDLKPLVDAVDRNTAVLEKLLTALTGLKPEIVIPKDAIKVVVEKSGPKELEVSHADGRKSTVRVT